MKTKLFAGLVAIGLAVLFSSTIHAAVKATSAKVAVPPVPGAVYTGADKDLSYKEVLEIKSVKDGEVTFDLDTEADLSGIGEVCEGEISGAKGKLQNHQVVFEGEQGCKLTLHFSKKKDSVSITDSNCNYYHGANCDFGGKNLKRTK
jgi:hypothetical protein